MPKFRRFGGYGAYAEGWGLYAEGLGKEMGFYREPISEFGMLSTQLWRAIRLVVDTGIHSQRWTRERAIDYFMANGLLSRRDATKEVERYFNNPGQATSYMIGQLKILELRDRARAALGNPLRHPRFPRRGAGERLGAARRAGDARQRLDRYPKDDKLMADTPPPTASPTIPRSPHFDMDALRRGVGVRFKGREREDVEEYCASEGWIRVAGRQGRRPPRRADHREAQRRARNLVARRGRGRRRRGRLGQPVPIDRRRHALDDALGEPRRLAGAPQRHAMLDPVGQRPAIGGRRPLQRPGNADELGLQRIGGHPHRGIAVGR